MQLSLALDDRLGLPRIRALLLAHFGPRDDGVRLDPVSQLVRAMIGNRTRDAVSGAAFRRLQLRYDGWQALGEAPASEIEALIRPVQHADRKALHLRQALRMIIARTGSLELDFLIDWSPAMAVHWLRGLPGVGAKVAAAVINFSTLRRRAMVVDTHLLRVGARLGLLPPDSDYETGHALFMRILPDGWDAGDLHEFHWLLKSLGQTCCPHGAPACRQCPLAEICMTAAGR